MRLFRAIPTAILIAAGVTTGQLSAPSGLLQGRVFDAAGQAISGAVILLTAEPSHAQLRTQSGRDGSYSFSQVKTDTDYEVRASYEGMGSIARPFRISNAGEKVGIDLRIGPRIVFQDVTAEAGIDFVQRNGATGHYYQPEIMIAGRRRSRLRRRWLHRHLLRQWRGATGTGQDRPGILQPSLPQRLRRHVRGRHGKSRSGRRRVTPWPSPPPTSTMTDTPTCSSPAATATYLYRNRGDGAFEDVTAKAGLGDSRAAGQSSAGWFDYDNDGWLDLFVSNYVAWDPNSEPSCGASGSAVLLPSRSISRTAEPALSQQSRRHVHGRVAQLGNRRAHRQRAWASRSRDFDGDGFTDVFVANDSVPQFPVPQSRRRHVSGDGREAGVALRDDGKPVAGMGADFRDFDNDGRHDLGPRRMSLRHLSAVSESRRARISRIAAQRTASRRATVAWTGWSLGMCDFDNDGSGRVSSRSRISPLGRYLGKSAAHANRVFRDGRDGRSKTSPGRGRGFSAGRAVPRRGIRGFRQRWPRGRGGHVVERAGRLFRNVSPGPAHWLAVRLAGAKSNRDGLGARVR